MNIYYDDDIEQVRSFARPSLTWVIRP